MLNNFIRKFAFDKIPLHGAFVELTDVWHTISSQKEYPDGIKQLLGELLVANILFTANIKLQGKIIAQIQDNPKLDLVVSECSHDLKVRATAKFTASAHQDNQISYADCINSGSLIITIDSDSDGKLYQSIVVLNGRSMSEILTEYMLQSQQLQTIFFIAYSEKKIVGCMLQKLPDVDGVYTEDIDRVFKIVETIEQHELLSTEIDIMLKNLFYEDDIILFDSQRISFSCTCGRQRVMNMLRSLGLEEATSIIEDEGIITVTCDFCNSVYSFNEQDVLTMFTNLSIDLECISDEIN